MIRLIIDNIYTKIDGIESPTLEKAIVKALTYEDKTSLYSIPFWARNKYATRCLYNKKTKKFPTGVLNYVIEAIESVGYEYEIIDKRRDIFPKSTIELKNKKLRDYQIEAVNKMLSVKNGILSSCTGSGKTVMFISIIGKYYGYKQLVIVRKQLLFAQTIREIESCLGIKVGYIGAGRYEYGDIMVAMAPTLARILDSNYKYKKSDDDEDDNEDDKSTYPQNVKDKIIEHLKNLDILIVDECHAMPSQTMVMIAKHCNAPYRYGFTATPYRNDGLEILMFAYIGPIIHKISASYLIKRGMLIGPKIHFINNPKPKEDIFEQDDYHSVYNKYIVNNYQRNKIAVDLIKKAYLKNEKIIVLVKCIEHGNIICDMLKDEGINAVYIHGENSLNERMEVIDNFRKNDGTVIISSSIPYNEYILIKKDGILELIEIGKLVERYTKGKYDFESVNISNENIYVLSLHKGKIKFCKIKNVIKHKNRNKIVEVKSSYNICKCTDNHSLIGEDFKSIEPVVNNSIIKCNNIKIKKKKDSVYKIIIKALSKIKVSGINLYVINNGIKKRKKLKNGDVLINISYKDNNFMLTNIRNKDFYFLLGYLFNNYKLINENVICIENYKNFDKIIKILDSIFNIRVDNIKITECGVFISSPFLMFLLCCLFTKSNVKDILINSNKNFIKNFLFGYKQNNVGLYRDDFVFMYYLSAMINEKIDFIIKDGLFFCDFKDNNIKDEFVCDYINSVEDIKNEEYVYDLSVCGSEKYFVGSGILAHNSILDEGVDIPEISVLVILGGGKSKTKYYQQIGRALRLSDNKSRAIIIDFLDSGVKFLEQHAKKRLSALKDEELFEVIKHI